MRFRSSKCFSNSLFSVAIMKIHFSVEKCEFLVIMELEGGDTMKFENEKMEFKAQMTEDLYKEIVAFANTDGGTVYIGVDDQGNVVGVDNVDDIYTRITNGIRDAILPDVTIFIKYVLQENRVIRIEVGEGTFKPYYLKAKGMKPSGVYIRQGACSAPASPEQIRRMIKESDGDVFEVMRAMKQKLTFSEALPCAIFGG